MDEARYVVFAAEAHAQLQQIALIHERIDHRERERGVAGLESLSYQLHNLYGAIEELMPWRPPIADHRTANPG